MAEPNSYDELVARVEALEAARLTLKDLPLAALQRKLETDWQPSASILLGSNSITEAMLGVKIVRGFAGGAGTIVNGTGWTIVKNAVGDYTVSFSAPFASVPIVVVGAGTGGNNYTAKLKAAVVPTAPAFSVSTFVTSTLAAIDNSFTFIAIGGP